ncbi:hypothetical protein C8N47_106139 [Mangrovibacterium marinum]|uniref:Uncharacterized protein n=1 Tax=Mangrovibacterium marinum TaxID=1639118 RepID=A0A2T5C2V7_9BACT|nr:hypothetical protein C8N47_106139 [Mangrovibacterium marinum]
MLIVRVKSESAEQNPSSTLICPQLESSSRNQKSEDYENIKRMTGRLMPPIDLNALCIGVRSTPIVVLEGHHAPN